MGIGLLLLVPNKYEQKEAKHQLGRLCMLVFEG